MEKNSDIKHHIQDWWAKNPMTYGKDHGRLEYLDDKGVVRSTIIGSRDFFESSDATLYQWNSPLHTANGKFGKLFDYDRFKDSSVLEIGCGMGCMAMNWAMHGSRMTVVDLNSVAIEQTRRRFEIFNLNANIVQVDAENLPFSNNAFDYVYSWGVLHHSPNLKRSINEIFRVLRPGGSFGIMLYNRHSFLYRYVIEYLEGFLHLENNFLNPLELASRYCDGAQSEGNPHTWPVITSEIQEELFIQFKNVQTRILGTDLDYVLDLWFPKLGSSLMPRYLIKALARHWGWSIWISGEKSF
jgi:ubiquinone/menaquinone biosynthesis C-methylase UbiE